MKGLLTVFKNKKLLISIAITLGLLTLFRVGTLIRLPNVTVNDNPDTTGFIDTINMLGGGGLTKVSIFAMGVSPYIMTSIIVQMLASSGIVPALNR